MRVYIHTTHERQVRVPNDAALSLPTSSSPACPQRFNYESFSPLLLLPFFLKTFRGLYISFNTLKVVSVTVTQPTDDNFRRFLHRFGLQLLHPRLLSPRLHPRDVLKIPHTIFSFLPRL